MASFTQEEKKSIIATVAFFVLLLLALFLAKFKFRNDLVDLEGGGGGGGGVTVNFGDSDVGMGDNFKSEELEVIKKGQKAAPAASAPEDNIISSDDEDVATVAKAPEVKKEPRKEDIKPTPVKTPQPSKAASDALANALRGNSKGDGDDNTAGNKGRRDGDKNSNSYYDGDGDGNGKGKGKGNGEGDGEGDGIGPGKGPGNGRGTGVGNYQLAGRKPMATPKPGGCNEEGTVAVQITVDNSGRVIGVATDRGTIASPCLINQAKQAALKTKFEPGDAEKQIGKIIYNFKLSE